MGPAVTAPAQPDDPVMMASVELLHRTGISEFQLRYSEEMQPVVWMAVVSYQRPGQIAHQTAGALTPRDAVYRLLELVIDGGQCTHCQRPTGVSDDFTGQMPLEQHICWYRYDPELRTFRRGCEGTGR